MNDNQKDFLVLPYPKARRLMVDGGKMGLKKHTVHGLVEFDITNALDTIRRYRMENRKALSFTAFFLACLGKAIDAEIEINAYRNWRNQMIVFKEVDVNMLFEVEIEGEKMVRPHIIKAVNKMSAQEIENQIQSFKKTHQDSKETKFIDWFVRLPGFIRRLFLWIIFKNPNQLKNYYGTVLVTSVGMFGSGTGWGIPVTNHSLQLTLGGIGEKLVMVNHSIETRKFLSVTVSFDHDIIDGAPAARFINSLKKLIEKGY